MAGVRLRKKKRSRALLNKIAGDVGRVSRRGRLGETELWAAIETSPSGEMKVAVASDFAGVLGSD